MTEEQFKALVETAEREVESNAGLYRLKLAMLAALGYLVIFLTLAVLAILMGGVVAAVFFSTSLALILLKKKLIIPVLAAAWVLAKALWVRFDKPDGYELKRGDYPGLFAEIDGLRGELNSLPIHRVLLTHEFNAAVVQTPRLGIFGWQHNTLILGLELLLSLSPEEARSVLAHEFGHLSRNHSSFSGWIYRVRSSWSRIMEAFEDSDSFGARILGRFFGWYAPYFSAYSFALARSNEYEADAVAARLTSPDVATRALVNAHVTSPYTDTRYWEQYFKKADALAEPDHMPYEGLARFLERHPPSRGQLQERVEQALQVNTSYADTHPALKDRIAALGSEPHVPPGIGAGNAAASWLGQRYQQVLGDFDRMWYESNGERWRGRYAYVQESLAALSELEARDGDLTDLEVWRKAMLIREFRPDQDPLPLFREYQERAPEDRDADYVIGSILYNRDEPACLDYLEKAAEKFEHALDAYKMGYYFLVEQHKEEAAEQWREKVNAQIEFQQRMAAERNSVEVDAALQAPELSDEDWQNIKEQLARAKNVKSAWIAQKVLHHRPEHDPVFIVAFKAKGFYWSWDNVTKRVLSALQSPVDLFVVVTGGDARKLAKRVRKAGKQIV